MTKKYLFVLALALGGCPAFEIPSPDGGLPDNFDQMNGPGGCIEGPDGGVCDGSGDVEPGPGQGGRGGGLAPGGGTGGAAQAGTGGVGGDPFRPVPGGDIGEAWGQALDHLYQVACQCTEVPPDQCMAMHAEERACEIANVQANAEIAGAYLECAITAVHEQADCMQKAACDPNLILDCVAVAADGQDHITARCGEPPAGIIEGEECSTSNEVSFPCFGGGEVPAHAVCDGFADCGDGSDEMVCEEPTDEYYECGDGTQIYSDWVCDGEADCSNGSDEVDCESVEPGPQPEFGCGDGTGIPLSWICDGTPDCSNGSDEADCAEDI